MRGRVRSSRGFATSGERRECRRQESLIARQRRERRSALHYANDIRQNEWPAHAKRQWCHILRKSFLSVLPPPPPPSSFLRPSRSSLRAYSPRGGTAANSCAVLSPNRVLRRDEYSANAITLFLAGLPRRATDRRRADRPFPAATRNTNQLKEQWGPRIPLSCARASTPNVRHKAHLFVYVLVYSFFLKRLSPLGRADLISHPDILDTASFRYY